LLLPRSDCEPVRPATEPLGDDPAQRSASGSILLVEDDDEVAALVLEMLHELGYRVTRVASAKAALGALADNREIDLIFSDVMMPGSMSGVELALEVRRRRPGLPFLLTTGYAGVSIDNAELPSIEVLSKPYEIAALDDALRMALGRGNARG
jgi:CheY-like chemotaxis protein